ncbi:unnamed protein product [Clavelina lepadiformis]|uniref:Caspase family p20 domain-containing protein n=1 Tax=Clavelina lepadiformis TaxID=159417 RepID=A0ABP0GJI4_CLALP
MIFLVYQVKEKPKGHVLILSNTKFPKWKALSSGRQFNKTQHKSLSRGVEGKKEHKLMKKLFEDVKRGTLLFGSDCAPVSVPEIVEKFCKSEDSHSLDGKPKVFFFQCCRGYGGNESDENESKYVPQDSSTPTLATAPRQMGLLSPMPHMLNYFTLFAELLQNFKTVLCTESKIVSQPDLFVGFSTLEGAFIISTQIMKNEKKYTSHKIRFSNRNLQFPEQDHVR